MATNSKTTKTKRTKKTRKTKKTKRTAAEETAAAEESGAGTAETEVKQPRTKRTTRRRKTAAGEGGADAASAETKSTTARPKRTRRKKTKQAAEQPEAETGAPSPAAKADNDEKRSVTRHESDDGTIVIRFPPAASSGADLESAADPDVATEAAELVDEELREALDDAAALREADESDEPDEVEPAERVATIDDDEADDETEEDDDTATATAEAEAPDAEESEAERQMSRSQKRRLRRKRRQQLLKQENGEPAKAPAKGQAPRVTAEAADEAVAETEAESSDETEETETTERAPRRRRRGRRRRREEPDVEAKVEAETEAEAEAETEDEADTDIIEVEAQVATAEEEAALEEEEAEPRIDRKALAAKPSSKIEREMLINFVPRDECRIAVLERGKLEEIYIERASYENHVGNIYKGVVTNVEPSIQAAFVDFGLGKNGFLHITDLHPDYFAGSSNMTENVGRKIPRRARPPIQKCLRRGQEVIVQITKEGIGTKGPTLSTYISIPGRFLVMMPGMRRLGISRKIEEDRSRDTLRKELSQLKLPEGIGFIARTAAQQRKTKELQSDLDYLARLWRAVERRSKSEKAPCEIYRESDLVIRTIRDVFTADVERILVDDPEVAERAREFLSIFSPRSRDIVIDYTDPAPLFHRYGIEAELERLHSRRVSLPSGGSLVIDATEALVAIDVNSGRFRTEEDAESTAFKLNMEAADEISRQLRLRDMGGVIVCDFIDMRQESHKRELERRLNGNLKKHKERAKILRMSQFGLVEITRQRQRASLTRNVYQDCPHCRGTGLVKTLESVVIDVMRQVQYAATRDHVSQIELTLAPDVANLLQNRKRAMLHQLETRHRRVVTIRQDDSFSQDQVHLQCYDQRGRQVPHA